MTNLKPLKDGAFKKNMCNSNCTESQNVMLLNLYCYLFSCDCNDLIIICNDLIAISLDPDQIPSIAAFDFDQKLCDKQQTTNTYTYLFL